MKRCKTCRIKVCDNYGKNIGACDEWIKKDGEK